MVRGRLAAVVAALCAVLSGTAAAAAGTFAPATAAAVTGADLTAAELAHVALDGAAPAAPEARRLVRAEGGTLVSPELGLWALPGARAARLVPRLARLGVLRYAEPAYRRDALVHFVDPLATREIGYHLYAVGADQAEPPAPGFPITVIDSGIDLAHPDFAGRANVVGLNNQFVPSTRPSEYHGTAVAAIAAAATNGVGGEGIYPAAALRSYDLGGNLSDPSIIRAISTAVAAGPSVINLSLGGPQNTRALYEATMLAVARGSLVVASSGNELLSGNPAIYPAAYPHVLTVASVNRASEPSIFSSAHPSVDLAAPGEELPVALPGGGHLLVSGTSFAAPVVAGAAAWVRTVRGAMHHTQLFDLLRFTARDVGEPGFDSRTGFGLLDLPAALSQPLPPVDPQEPNDDIAQVVAGGLFTAARPLVSARFRARLDATEDPHDVYRVSVPPRRQLTVRVTADDDVRVALFGPAATTVRSSRGRLARSDAPGTAAERVVYANRTGRAVVLFLHMSPGLRGDAVNPAYTVRLSRAALPLPSR